MGEMTKLNKLLPLGETTKLGAEEQNFLLFFPLSFFPAFLASVCRAFLLGALQQNFWILPDLLNERVSE